MNVLITGAIWLLLAVMAGIAIHGTVGDGTLSWMIAEARRSKRMKDNSEGSRV